MMKMKHFVFLTSLILSSCKYVGQESLTNESSSSYMGHESAKSGMVYAPSQPQDQGTFSGSTLLGSGSGKANEVAKVASAMIGKENCTKFPKRSLKCAQQASDILKTAGVKVKGSYSVSGLVYQLRKVGWRDGACGPGSVRHSAGKKPSHIGVVIDQNGKTVHNSSKLGSSYRCGRLGTLPYNSWKNRSRCLVPPETL